MINPVKSFLTHGPLILKEIYTNKFQKYTHTIIATSFLDSTEDSRIREGIARKKKENTCLGAETGPLPRPYRFNL